MISVRFSLDGREIVLPADWTLCLESGGEPDSMIMAVHVKRGDELLSIGEAIALKEILTTSSKPHNKTSIL